MTTTPSSSLAAAVESFVGIRIPLPTGKTFVARKPLFFEDALRWQELFENYQTGKQPYSATLKVIVTEMKEKTDPEDLSVLQELTLGEFIDWVLLSFFSHRRSVPGWILALAQQAAKATETAPAPGDPSPT